MGVFYPSLLEWKAYLLEAYLLDLIVYPAVLWYVG